MWQLATFILTFQSMARANLNKSKKVLTYTTTASKYIPKRLRICIIWIPPFQTQIYLVKVPLNMNIVKPIYSVFHLKNSKSKKLAFIKISTWSHSWVASSLQWCEKWHCQMKVGMLIEKVRMHVSIWWVDLGVESLQNRRWYRQRGVQE